MQQQQQHACPPAHPHASMRMSRTFAHMSRVPLVATRLNLFDHTLILSVHLLKLHVRVLAGATAGATTVATTVGERGTIAAATVRFAAAAAAAVYPWLRSCR